VITVTAAQAIDEFFIKRPVGPAIPLRFGFVGLSCFTLGLSVHSSGIECETTLGVPNSAFSLPAPCQS
jgi:hypothetical protein